MNTFKNTDKKTKKTTYFKVVQGDSKTKRRVEISKAEFATLQQRTPAHSDSPEGDNRYLDNLLKKNVIDKKLSNLTYAECQYILEKEQAAKNPRIDLINSVKERAKFQKEVEDARNKKTTKKKTTKKKAAKK